LQYVRGIANTSKTKIIKIVQGYFLKMKNKQNLQITINISNADLLINGTTIHSLLGLSINKHTSTNKPNSITDVWPNIQFISINKILMVGCTLLATMHLKLHKLKYNVLPFERINIIFMVDFLQVFPINDTS
jgi:hypothetical protein